ncbi:MAG: ATP-binding cassette domain-containing protein [Bacteroidales bacterium]|nr:ATP-binding cassette domain-containing protein [Bacteroidales bacterium]
MSEDILNALVRLFALIADIHGERVITGKEKEVVRSFLSRHLNRELTERYMLMYEEYLAAFAADNITKGTLRDRKRTSLNAMKILGICENINTELRHKQKIYVLVQLADYISRAEEISENELDFLQTVASAFNIDNHEFPDIKTFIVDRSLDLKEKKNAVLITGSKPETGGFRYIHDENLEGQAAFLYIASTNSFIMRYEGPADLYLNGQNISGDQPYIFDRGSVLRGAGINTVYYSKIVSMITEAKPGFRVTLDANNISYRFPRSDNGIHNLSIHEESGKLVGILGGSGAGKSTTLSILNGTLKPDSGKVIINGYDLYNEEDRKELRGVIGLVPQDDLLIEELTVFQNIYFSAKMCLSSLSEEEILETVNRILVDFDLDEIKDLKVGNPLKKVISGGQRKRVNIALEMLREPTILFVDEPTSGLSSVDSEAVMNLLKEQTAKGKLVIINIHQPGSETYKMFDRVMFIDRGGYQVWYGDPSEAIVYFKTLSNHANPEEDQCVSCGNIDTEQILQIIEAKVVDERGMPTRTRKISPAEWAEKFREKYLSGIRRTPSGKEPLPANSFSIPGLIMQSVIFFRRDLLSKLADKQYILISVFGAPVLAMILAWFTRFSGGEEYRFSDNGNIKAYIFMCVITSLFFGLMSSSEEIVRDRKILRRESFLNLSWFSYLNSKILLMFILSAIQTFLFVVAGNLILGIKGMFLSYWFVLFTTSCLANILGLNLSSAFNSVITIYILIPFVIIPQLLFSGVLVSFDKLHLSNSKQEFVPVLGDLMPARWSFEALAVHQFSSNRYEKPFFEYKMIQSQNQYYAEFLTEALIESLQTCTKIKDDPAEKDRLDEYFSRIRSSLDLLSDSSLIKIPEWQASLSPENYSAEVERKATEFLEALRRKTFVKKMNNAGRQIENIKLTREKEIGKDRLVRLRYDYENEDLKNLLLGSLNLKQDMTFNADDRIIQKFQPGYMKATSRYGRAHYYAPVKRLGDIEIRTYWFNTAVLWIVSVLLFLALYFKLLQKLLDYIGRFRGSA